MATSKKTTTKKPTTRTTKAAVSKKTTTVSKKAPARKPAAKSTATTKKTASKSTRAKKPAMRSFHVSADDQAFSSFRITRQTVYWIILVAFIIFVQLWILKLQIEVVTLIDAQQAQLQNY